MTEGVPILCRGKSYEMEILVSPEDYEWVVSRGNWFVTHATRQNGKNYAVRSEKGVLVFLHKAILVRSFKLPPSPLHIIGDHRNGNSLDNRRNNLRWATPKMNANNIFGFVERQMELSDDWH